MRRLDVPWRCMTVRNLTMTLEDGRIRTWRLPAFSGVSISNIVRMLLSGPMYLLGVVDRIEAVVEDGSLDHVGGIGRFSVAEGD
jgi:hypothetical protein